MRFIPIGETVEISTILYKLKYHRRGEDSCKEKRGEVSGLKKEEAKREKDGKKKGYRKQKKGRRVERERRGRSKKNY